MTKHTRRRVTVARKSPENLRVALEPEVSPTRDFGEYLITIQEESELEALGTLEQAAGIRVASTSSLSADEIAAEMGRPPGEGLMLSRLGVAVAALDPDQLKSLKKHNGKTLVAIEPAPVFFAFMPISSDYLRGYRDCIDALLRGSEPAGGAASALAEQPLATTESATWGLRATAVTSSRYSGAGIRVAVLDTGLDLQHSDFANRRITHQSFIPGEEVQDRHGHGTHCIGTACGPARPSRGQRYGIAYEADIFAGKVLSNTGGSRGRSVELGIEWALANRCHVISMSLGSAVLPGTPPIMAYERIGARALRAGTLIIAAAGNESVRRRGIINPVGSPANCPSMMGIGAVDSSSNVADFSNGGINPSGGEINLVAPGVDIYSSIPSNSYGIKSGTSMATPHVAGIAALWAQATNEAGQKLWDLLIQNAKPLGGDIRDFGNGLAQAPPGTS